MNYFSIARANIRELLPQGRSGDDSLKRFAEANVEHYQIVGATLAKLSLMVFLQKLKWSNPIFDWVIVDESSMAPLALVLVGLMLGKRVVLIGDHEQLPPIVHVDSAPLIKVSLFERMISSYPESSVMLNIRYRSNEKISEWPSSFIYNGRIRTDLSVRNSKLDFTITSDETDVVKILDSSHPIVWVDTGRSGYEKWVKYGGGWSAYNILEAAITLRIYSGSW